MPGPGRIGGHTIRVERDYIQLVQGGRTGRGQSAQWLCGREYGYKKSLLEMDGCRVVSGKGRLPDSACVVATPLRVDVLERELAQLPDRALVGYLVDGMRHGFRVGYKRGVAPLVRARRNML